MSKQSSVAEMVGTLTRHRVYPFFIMLRPIGDRGVAESDFFLLNKIVQMDGIAGGYRKRRSIFGTQVERNKYTDLYHGLVQSH